MTNEILAELHAIKDALSARYVGDVYSILADIKKGEDDLRAKGFKFVSPPAYPAAMVGTAFQRNRFAHRQA
ncbi:MAG: hypothetical protein K9K38_13015 [Rhodoferax sp.]|nr:hypothetical protein [Rhodoferax sp.]